MRWKQGFSSEGQILWAAEQRSWGTAVCGAQGPQGALDGGEELEGKPPLFQPALQAWSTAAFSGEEESAALRPTQKAVLRWLALHLQIQRARSV